MEQLTVEELRCLYKKDIDIMHSEYFSYRQFEEAAIRIGESRAYETAGYTTFEAFHKSEFPDAHKISSRKYQLLKFVEVVADVAQYQAQNPNLVENYFIPNNERQARALVSLPSEERGPTFELAVELAGGQPSGRQITETVAALRPTTDERIGRLDTDRAAKPTPQPAAPKSGQPKKTFGYIETESVLTLTHDRKLTFTYFRPAFTTFQGKPVKAQKVEGLAIPFRILESQGWTAPVLTDEERERYEPEDDKPASLLDGRDLSQVRRKAQPETSVAAEALNLMLGDDEEPVPSFTSGIDFADLDALAKPFDDGYSQ